MVLLGVGVRRLEGRSFASFSLSSVPLCSKLLGAAGRDGGGGFACRDRGGGVIDEFLCGGGCASPGATTRGGAGGGSFACGVVLARIAPRTISFQFRAAAYWSLLAQTVHDGAYHQLLAQSRRISPRHREL